MAVRVEAEAAGRAQALGEPYEPALDGVAAALRERPAPPATTRHARGAGWLRPSCPAADAAGRRARGFRPWEEVALAFDAIALPLPAVYARFRAGEALVTAGDRAAAACRCAPRPPSRSGPAPALGDGRRGARPPRAHRPERARARAVPPAPDDSPAARLGLTPRELEVLLLVAEGRTNRVIGETLFMSEKTASVHVSRILAKLGVHGRVEAAAVAHRLGLAGAARA